MLKLSVYNILIEILKMKCVCSTWVPHMLTHEQMNQRRTTCEQWFMTLAEKPQYLEHIITCDESWVHHYDPKIWLESCAWTSSTSPETKKV